MILTAMATGAVDYFVKGSQDEWLFEHIRMAYAGNPTMSERTQRVMLQEYSRLRHNETSLLYFVNTLSLLTPTERELVRYLLQGLNARQISEVRVVAPVSYTHLDVYKRQIEEGTPVQREENTTYLEDGRVMDFTVQFYNPTRYRLEYYRKR